MLTKILLVDDSPVRQPFLSEMLTTSGKVTPFRADDEAVAAVKRGLAVDVAVVHYKRTSTPLIRAIRDQYPGANIVAFGGPRQSPPSGVDAYLNKPVLGADVRELVDQFSQRRKG